MNALPTDATEIDFCEEDQCPEYQDKYIWHTNSDSSTFHRKGSYYNNFQELGDYPSERNLLSLLYNNPNNYYPGISYDDKNNSINYTYGAYNNKYVEKDHLDRKLDYLFTNYSNWSSTGKTHQEAKDLSDHVPVSAILSRN